MSSAYNWPHEGCECLWHFENNALDSSGNGHDGTDSGGVTFAFGRFGKCAVFDGTARFALSLDAAMMLTTFTILMWYKSTDASGRAVLFTASGIKVNSADSNFYGYDIETASGMPRLLIGSGSIRWALTLAGSTAINDGAWHFLAATRDADYARVYVDGEIVAEEETPPTPNFGTSAAYRCCSIGGAYVDGYTPLSIGYLPTCRMDELQLLDYALTPAQMSRLYAFQRGVL